ncbi:MAG: methylenetetrahydrofolate reductase [Oscillospiraceae bacterium]|jgi:methylenetetrahydrofolate reductase (NADPH)|nr:methylenetetrahydrofolate reductase [Oscillospiraceae bacterium]
MRIDELYKIKSPVISFEVFPPKKADGFDAVLGALRELAPLSPDFMSVTCGAGGTGGAERLTRAIASAIRKEHDIEPLAHLTCIASDPETVKSAAGALREEGVYNILALRGDLPGGREITGERHYRFASRLISDLMGLGDFCVGAACYPEGHIECESREEDLIHLKEKQEAGASFLITQLFFDNGVFFRFMERARSGGIHLPVSAGVMPILSRGQIERMIFMCGASLPSAIIRLLHKYEHSPDDLRKAGVEHAARQMEALISGGAQGIHIYTMNHPDIAASAMSKLR